MFCQILFLFTSFPYFSMYLLLRPWEIRGRGRKQDEIHTATTALTCAIQRVTIHHNATILSDIVSSMECTPSSPPRTAQPHTKPPSSNPSVPSTTTKTRCHRSGTTCAAHSRVLEEPCAKLEPERPRPKRRHHPGGLVLRLGPSPRRRRA